MSMFGERSLVVIMNVQGNPGGLVTGNMLQKLFQFTCSQSPLKPYKECMPLGLYAILKLIFDVPVAFQP